MTKHDYTAKQAFDLIKKTLEKKSPALWERIREAINEGTEDPSFEEENPTKQSSGGIRPYSPDEALKIIFQVLKTYLLQTRQMINEATKELNQTPTSNLSADKIRYKRSTQDPLETRYEDLRIVIDTEPEGAFPFGDRAYVHMKETDDSSLGELLLAFDRLEKLVDFREVQNGQS